MQRPLPMHLVTGMSSCLGDMRPCRDVLRRRDLGAKALGCSATDVDHTGPIKPCFTRAGNVASQVGRETRGGGGGGTRQL